MQAAARFVFFLCVLVWTVAFIRLLLTSRRQKRRQLTEAVDRYTIWVEAVVIPRRLTRHDATNYVAHLPERDWDDWLNQVSQWVYRTYRIKVDHRVSVGLTGRRLHLVFAHWQRAERHRNFSA